MAIFLPSDRVALYVHLRTFESDFDKSQSQVRAISSAWTAAVLAAVALLITTAATPVVFPDGAHLKPDGLIEVRTDTLAYLRAAICLVGSAGVLAFWSIDQWVYQRLLHSVFAYGLFVEMKEPELPQVRSAMFLANLDVTNRLGIFYRAQFWLFVLVSIGVDLISRNVGHTSIDPEVWYVIGPHLVAVIICEIFISHKWPSLDHTIQEFYPELARVLPSRKGAENQQPAPSSFDSSTDDRMPAFLTRIRHQGYRYEG